MLRSMILLLFSSLLVVSHAVYIISTNEIIPHVVAEFVSVDTKVTGLLGFANPIRGCEDYTTESIGRIRGNIVMIARGDCSFMEKAIRAQKYGAVGVIIANNDTGVIRMGADGVHKREDIKVPVVMVGLSEARYMAMISNMYQLTVSIDATGAVDPSPNQAESSSTIQALNNIIHLVIFMAASFPTLWVFWVVCLMGGRGVQRCWDKVRRRRKLELIPTVYYSPVYSHDKDDPEYVHNNSCVICLDEFVEGQSLKRLPCMHGFCADCIRSWLADRSDQCPICKKSILLDESRTHCMVDFCSTFSVWRHRRSRRAVAAEDHEAQPNPIGMENIDHYCDDT